MAIYPALFHFFTFPLFHFAPSQPRRLKTEEFFATNLHEWHEWERVIEKRARGGHLPGPFLTFSPIHFLTFSPFHLFTFSPFHFFTFSLSHFFTFSLFHFFTFALSPYLPFSRSPYSLFPNAKRRRSKWDFRRLQTTSQSSKMVSSETR